MELLNQLLERNDLVTYLPKIPEQEMYFLLKRIGLQDSVELLRHCSPEQIQACFDLEAWQKDHVAPDRMIPWLEALLEVGPAKIGQVVEVLDHEFLVTWLRHEIRVYELSAEEAPEDPEGQFYTTPDQFYLVDIISKQNVATIGRLLEALYMKDPNLGRRVMMGVKWDVGPESEEAAYRFHSARMSDMGYVEMYEALQMYQLIDPATVKIGEGTGPNFAEVWAEAQTQAFLPQDWIDGVHTEKLLLSHSLRALSAKEQKVLFPHLLFLLNRALSAEAVDITDPQAVKPVIEYTLGCLSLGIEYVSLKPQPLAEKAQEQSKNEENNLAASSQKRQEFIQMGAEALRTISLKRLFQVGYSLIHRLLRLAQILTKKSLTTLVPKTDKASLLPAPYADVIDCLFQHPRRLMYHGGLDTPKMMSPRPFQTLADIQKTATALEEIGGLGQFLTVGLGLRTETLIQTLSSCYQLVGEVHFTDILGTMIANFILGRPPSLVPLKKEDLIPLRQEGLSPVSHPAKLRPAIYKKVDEMLKIRIKERSLNEEEEKGLWSGAVKELLEKTLEQLAESLALLPEEERGLTDSMVRALSGVLVERKKATAEA